MNVDQSPITERVLVTRESKPIWYSKTFWFNLLSGVAALVVELASVPDLGLDPKSVIVALAVANMVLRYTTSQPVSLQRDGRP
jgi:hypothetical protein